MHTAIIIILSCMKKTKPPGSWEGLPGAARKTQE